MPAFKRGDLVRNRALGTTYWVMKVLDDGYVLENRTRTFKVSREADRWYVLDNGVVGPP